MPTLFKRPATAYRRPVYSGGLNRTVPARDVPLKLDPVIIAISLAFVVVGLLFTYSASAFETSSFVKRQIVFDGVGIIAAWVLAYRFTRLLKYKLFSPPVLLGISWALLIIVLFTRAQAHTHRWIDVFGLFKLQPSEIAKVTLVIYVASCLEETAGRLSKDWTLLKKPLIAAGITLGLIAAGKDLGTPMLMGVVFIAMLFVSGVRMKFLAVLGGLASAAGLLFMLSVPYRRARLFSFLHLTEDNSAGISYQVQQSFMAVGSGGVFGKGLGNSELKLQYLPAAHTDFIFSVMCEEIGLLVLLIVGGFTLLLWRGILLAKTAKTTFNSMVILGLTLTLCSQAFFNMGMAIGLLPTKGIALPFFSYGGSSVVMTLVMIGIILNVAAVDHTQTNVRRDSLFTTRKRS